MDSTNQKRLPANAHAHSDVFQVLYERLHVDAIIMRSFQTEIFSSFMPSTYAGHVNLAAAKHWQFMLNWKYGSTVEFIMFRV